MTKPDDIPQDVWDEALRQWRIGRGFGTIDIIARAILAERERCAKIAESHGTSMGVWGENMSVIPLSGIIAKDIRNPNT